MNQETQFGTFVRQRRREMDLTQEELARRVGCAAITLRKIEAEDLRASIQIAERLAMALAIPLEERAEFVRRARAVMPEGGDVPPVTPPPSMEEIGREDLTGRAIRGYALAERIGMGGMGSVYRAVQPNVEREVAVKIILPAFANHPDFIRRFEAEAQLVARLEHPHIVPLYDYWREPGVAYLVMRLLRGGNVQSLLGQGPLALETTAHMLEQICSALHAAHRTGVIHRDLKPANVLLDDDQNAYLADFGLAKNLGNPDLENATQMDAIIGSPQYMSPEQIRSLSVRPQTDIYCLGVMLYEMLTGVLPFRGPTPFDLIQQHMNTPMPPLAANQAGLPAALDAVVGRATAKEPEERYVDALALFHDFREALGLVVGAGPVTVAYEEEETDIDVPNPFKGLRAFGEADADDFFGRETLVQQLLSRLGEGGELSRFLAVIGPSGSGKSSVVRAGLIPALRRGGLPGSENWFVLDMLPGKHPFEELEAALLRVAVNPPEHLLSQLKDGPRGLLRAVQRVLPADESVELVLVIDQFEEVFTLVEDEAERALLLESLATVVLDERSRLRAVITLRADFTDKPLRYVDFGELIDRRFEFVLPLTADEVERAVAGPAQRAGLRLEKGLVSTIIREAGDQPGTLPLLQHAMAELFERRERRTLTLKVYHEIGGVLGALGRTAEAIYDGLDEAGMAAARQVFLRLVTLGEGAEDTRRRVLLSEIEALFGDEQASVGNVLEAYGKARLLTFDRDPLTRGATVEVAHEALLREWGRLGEWLDESRSDVRLQRQLAAAAAEWGAGGNDASFLFTGSRLGQFAGWAASTTIALTPDERAFLEAGIAERDRREQEEQARQQRELEAAQKLAEEQSRRADEQAHAAGRLRRRAYLLAGAFALAILLAGVAAFFGNQANRNAAAAQESALSAQENADQALQNAAAAQNAQATAQAERGRADQAARVASSRELAAQSALKLEKDPELSMLLALAAYDASPSKEAVDALHQAVDTSRLIMTIKAQDSAIAWNNVIVDLAMSPDGKRFASASAGDKPLKIWDTATGALLMTLAVTLAGPTDWVQAVRFSPDGTLLASASAGGTVEVWDLSTGSERFAIRTEQPPNSVDFSPDGAWLISAAGRTQIGFWDTRTGVQLFALSSPDWVAGTTPLEAMSEALSADGTRMAIYLCTAARTYCRVEIWNVSARQRERILFTTSEQLALDRNHGMSFGPDGSRLAIVRTEVVFGPGSVWDVNSGQKLYNLGSGLNKVVFSADGGYLFSATGGGTASIWDAATGRQLVSLAGHQSRVEAIAVNSNCPQWSSLGWCGTRLISGDDDGNVKIWDITPGGRGEGLVVPGAPFSVDGDWSHLTTAGARQVGKDKNAVTFWRWTIPTWAQDGLSHLPAPDTFSVEFPADSPVADVEGGFFLNVAKDGRITLLDTATPGGSQSLGCCFETSDNSLSSTTRSVSANLLAIAGTNGIVQFWDTASGRQLQNLRAQQPDEIDPSGINSIGPMALSSDGKRLATVSSDSGDTKIWDLATRRMLLTLPGELHPSHAAFSPDGRLIAIAHCGGFISVWDARTGNIKIRLLGHTACISPITFSPDGTRLASTSADRTLRIWDLQTAGELLTISMGGPGTLPGGGAGLTALAFSPDDKMLLASVAYNGGTDVDTRSFLLEPEALVALAKSRLTRGFTTDECQRYLHMDVCPPEP